MGGSNDLVEIGFLQQGLEEGVGVRDAVLGDEGCVRSQAIAPIQG